MSTAAEQFALSILQRLQTAGHVAYFAGGCVRDRLMRNVPKDFDVATSATPEQVLRLFPRSQEVGAAFGVILVRERRQGAAAPIQIEVATFRSDGMYSDGRHPDSVRFTTAQEDAQRRDFTCNGLFLDPLANDGHGEIHDFVGGQADIAAKVLRAIGDPAARFTEDHLRMLRAVRFAARLGFTIEEGTRAAIEGQAAKIRSISRERIGDEFGRILEHPSRGVGVRLMEALGLLLQVWPTDTWPNATRGTVGWERVDHLPATSPRLLGLAAVLRDVWESSGGAVAAELWSRAAERLQEKFALSNEERDDFLWLGQKLPLLLERSAWARRAHKKLLADRRWPLLHALYVAERGGLPDTELDAWTEQLRGEPGGVAPAPFVNGDTLIRMGARPGRAFKQWLEELYDRQLENEFTTAEEALRAARVLIDAGR